MLWRLASVCSLFLSVATALGDDAIRFEDVSESLGLNRLLEKPDGKRPWRYAHGAAWGDVDGDGRPELFAGAFAGRKYFTGDDSPVPNGLFWNRNAGFERADEPALDATAGNARCAGALFADLDGDGDLDLVVTNHMQKPDQDGSKLYENKDGHFRDVTPKSAPWTERLGMRNAAVIDVNRDGKLDLLLADGSYGADATTKARLLLLVNHGDWNFVDEGAKYGLPHGKTLGLGLAIGDLNNDGWPDLFVAGSQRLFVTDDAGKFREAHPGKFAFPPVDKSEGLHCGAAFGDLNNDGLLDLVTTEHGVPAKIHVFQNQGIEAGVPMLVEVSGDCGLGEALPPGTRARPIKTAHVALKDVDCDGRIDVITTLVAQDDHGNLQPVVLRNETAGGAIQLSAIPRERLVGYFAPGPVGDFDRDGRVDIFLPSWFEDLPNYLFRNTSKGGNWLTVRVTGTAMGIGAVVTAYQAGGLGDDAKRIMRTDITIGNGYASGEEALAHLGLGSAKSCDLRVALNGKTIDRRDVTTNTFVVLDADGPKAKQAAVPDKLTFPPELPDGKTSVSFTSDDVLNRPEGFPQNVAIAKTPPKIDFRYYPGQDYEGKPWSNWGDATFAAGKYFSAIGDHTAPRGRAFVFMFDPAKDELKMLTDVTKTIDLPEGHYTPGKIHTHVDMGKDGRVYFATHRGSTKATTDANFFTGEWILRADPATGKSEVVVRGPVPKHCIPNGLLDSERLIYYGGTAPGVGGDNVGIHFFAYDVEKKKVLYDGEDGPARSMILARSTGRVYYTPRLQDWPLMRFDPKVGKPVEIPGKIGIRAATTETAAGKVFTVSQGNKESPTTIYCFDVKTEQVETLGPAAVGKNEYIAALKVDPTGRYLYYIPGAHGGADSDGSPVIQYDTKTKTRKVLAFLAPYFQSHFRCTPKGTYGWALDGAGETLYVTWNISRGGKNWDCCGLMTLQVPPGEREN